MAGGKSLGFGRPGAALGAGVFGLIMLFLFLAHPVNSYSNGAGGGSCYDGWPSHGANAQSAPSPYKITTDVTTIDSTNPGQGVTVNMTATDPSQPFLGFIMSGTNLAVVNGIVGTFSKLKSTDKSVQLDNCLQISDTVTHTDSSSKTLVSVRWTPPAGYTGNVTFRGTFVKSKRVFWYAVRAPVVVVHKGGSPASTVVGTTANVASVNTTVKPGGPKGPATTIKRKRKTTVKKPAVKSTTKSANKSTTKSAAQGANGFGGFIMMDGK